MESGCGGAGHLGDAHRRRPLPARRTRRPGSARRPRRHGRRISASSAPASTSPSCSSATPHRATFPALARSGPSATSTWRRVGRFGNLVSSGRRHAHLVATGAVHRRPSQPRPSTTTTSACTRDASPDRSSVAVASDCFTLQYLDFSVPSRGGRSLLRVSRRGRRASGRASTEWYACLYAGFRTLIEALTLRGTPGPRIALRAAADTRQSVRLLRRSRLYLERPPR